jgi:hypothetical protein
MPVFDRATQSSRARKASFIFLGWVALSAMTAVVGPFSTFDTMPLEVRFFYWGGIIGSALILSEGVKWAAAKFKPSSPLHADLIGTALMAPSFGTAITWFNARVLDHDNPFVTALGVNVVVVLLVCFCVVLFRAYVRHLAVGREDAENAAALSVEDVQPSEPLPGFLRDIDPEIGHSVRWIKADNHYLHVHATKGSTRVLMRFRDALSDLSHLPGLQVHRSHWVRIEAVDEVRCEGRRHVAVLDCGTEVPVSRSYLGDLQGAGLLPQDGASARR